MTGDAQRGIHHATVEQEERWIQAQKTDDAADHEKNPTDWLAKERPNASSALCGRHVPFDREDSFVGGHETIWLPQEDLLVLLFLFSKLLRV